MNMDTIGYYLFMEKCEKEEQKKQQEQRKVNVNSENLLEQEKVTQSRKSEHI